MIIKHKEIVCLIALQIGSIRAPYTAAAATAASCGFCLLSSASAPFCEGIYTGAASKLVTVRHGMAHDDSLQLVLLQDTVDVVRNLGLAGPRAHCCDRHHLG